MTGQPLTTEQKLDVAEGAARIRARETTLLVEAAIVLAIFAIAVEMLWRFV